ncbi:hypothetical protein FRB90_002098 [Tulasnella sp. 427]|nr:hypothetical protein FRB90_002098 [Tulasnella sp. 427]
MDVLEDIRMQGENIIVRLENIGAHVKCVDESVSVEEWQTSAGYVIDAVRRFNSTLCRRFKMPHTGGERAVQRKAVDPGPNVEHAGAFDVEMESGEETTAVKGAQTVGHEETPMDRHVTPGVNMETPGDRDGGTMDGTGWIPDGETRDTSDSAGAGAHGGVDDDDEKGGSGLRAELTSARDPDILRVEGAVDDIFEREGESDTEKRWASCITYMKYMATMANLGCWEKILSGSDPWMRTVGEVGGLEGYDRLQALMENLDTQKISHAHKKAMDLDNEGSDLFKRYLNRYRSRAEGYELEEFLALTEKFKTVGAAL